MNIGLIEQMIENPGVPTRAPSVAVFTVDTADRYKLDAFGFRADITPVNDIYINKQQSVINGYFTRVALTEFNMPWNIPNVNERNNTFTAAISADGEFAELTATIPEGFYTGTQLATALQDTLEAQLLALGPPFVANNNFVVQYSTTTGKFTIENTLAEWEIVPKNNGPRDDLLNMMGFGAIPSTALVSGGPFFKFVGDVASMKYTPFFDIVSKQLTKKQQVNDSGTSYITGTSLLARIYVSYVDVVQDDFTNPLGSQPFTIRREFIIPKQIYWDTKEFLNVIDLTLIDYKGRVLYEPTFKEIEGGDTLQLGTSASNWQLTLQVSEI
jgi:hypothetical protein